jgi:hypothetical protein
LLYRFLQIQFQGNRSGDIVIDKCYFSQYYSGQTCGLMSAVDAGVIAGLADGGVMTFLQRITEGKPCCRAQFVFTEQNS